MEILNYSVVPKLTTEVVFPLSDETKSLIAGMKATLIGTGGYGLAAPQVGSNAKIFVYRKSSTSSKIIVVINPEVVLSSGKMLSVNEGCLSVPGERRTIKRAKVFKIRYKNESGEEELLRATSKLETIILQHENDHLLGITILDHK